MRRVSFMTPGVDICPSAIDMRLRRSIYDESFDMFASRTRKIFADDLRQPAGLRLDVQIHQKSIIIIIIIAQLKPAGVVVYNIRDGTNK